MIKIVIDTNILFSAILNTNSKFAQILLTDKNDILILAPDYMNKEILAHKQNILTLKNISEDEFNSIYELLTTKITFINHKEIPIEMMNKAQEICEDVDIDDTYFVASALYYKCKLWTCDKKLINGLSVKGQNIFITTSELFSIYFNEL